MVKKQNKAIDFQIWKGNASVSPEGLKWAKSSIGLIESLVNNTSVPAYTKNDRPVILIIVPGKAALMESVIPLVDKLSSEYSVYFFTFATLGQETKLEQESKDFITDMNQFSCVLMPCNNLRILGRPVAVPGKISCGCDVEKFTHGIFSL